MRSYQVIFENGAKLFIEAESAEEAMESAVQEIANITGLSKEAVVRIKEVKTI